MKIEAGEDFKAGKMVYVRDGLAYTAKVLDDIDYMRGFVYPVGAIDYAPPISRWGEWSDPGPPTATRSAARKRHRKAMKKRGRR
jgi:hypothetical protein